MEPIFTGDTLLDIFCQKSEFSLKFRLPKYIIISSFRIKCKKEYYLVIKGENNEGVYLIILYLYIIYLNSTYYRELELKEEFLQSPQDDIRHRKLLGLTPLLIINHGG